MGSGETGVLIGASFSGAGGQIPIVPAVAPIARGLTQPVGEHAFAHPAEEDLARILSFYRIRWVYEPTTFHLEVREDGRPAEQITPDFYLPDHDLFIELTTMRQRLVTRKNRKIRRLREIFPSVQIKLLYRKDYDRLIGAYPAPDQISDPLLGEVVIDADAVKHRIAGLAEEIYESSVTLASINGGGRQQRIAPLHLIGVGAGTRRVLDDLAVRLDELACCVTSDQLLLSRYGSGHGNDRVRVGGSLKTSVAGRDVVLVSDVVSSGLSLVYVTDWLRARGARSVRVCALLDRDDARIIDVPLDFVGFQAPDEVLVGYGLSSHPQFRDLPYIATIRETEEFSTGN